MKSQYIPSSLATVLIVLAMAAGPAFAQNGLQFYKKESDKVQSFPPPITGQMFEQSMLTVGGGTQQIATDFALEGALGAMPVPCGDEAWSGGRLVVQLDLGDDYELGRAMNETPKVNMSLDWRLNNGSNPPYTSNNPFELQIDVGNPEKRRIFDISSLLSGQSNISNLLEMKLTIHSYVQPTALEIRSRVRLRVWVESETTTLVPQLPYGLVRTAPVSANVNDRIVTFSWAGDGCAENFDEYQFQLLRLYNINPANTSIDVITAEPDWDEALTLEVPRTDITLTLAEGTGYYVWRVRPLATFHEHGAADPRNWGDYTTTPALDPQGQFTINAGSPAQPILEGTFFYNQFDDDINWKFGRSFIEGGKYREQMAYASSTLVTEQVQVRLQSQQERIITQSYTDYVGRKAVQTLPVPFVDGGTNAFQFVPGIDLLSVGVQAFSAQHFDDVDPGNNTFADPTEPDGGAITEYYSSNSGATNNIEDHVPDAEGFVFSRSQFYPDGTNAVRRSASVGREFSISGDHTTQMSYAQATEEELIRLFGSEAPRSDAVRKIINVDANGTTSIQFVNKSGQVIANGLAPDPGTDPMLANLEPQYDPETFAGQTSRTIDVLNQNGEKVEGVWTTPSSNKVGQKVVLTSSQSLSFDYSITPTQLELDCPDFCAECDFKIYFRIFNLADNSRIMFESLEFSPASINVGEGAVCDPATGQLVFVDPNTGLPYVSPVLDPGTYWIEREIVFNTQKADVYYVDGDPNSGSRNISHLEYYRELIANTVRDEFYALGANGYTLTQLEEEFLTEEAMNQYESLDEFYTAVDQAFGGLVLAAGCDALVIPQYYCESAEDCHDPQDYIDELYATFPVGSGTPYDNFSSLFGMYCSPAKPAEIHPAHPEMGGYVNNASDIKEDDFKAMIDNMVAAGFDCNKLWNCWNSAIDLREQLVGIKTNHPFTQHNPPLDPDPNHNEPDVKNCVSLIDLFFDCTGLAYETIHPDEQAYRTSSADYKERAFDRFRGNPGGDHYDFCEAHATQLFGANPTGEALLAKNAYIYNCWIKSKNDGITYPDPNNPTEMAEVFDLKTRCDESCISRENEFRDMIKEAYLKYDPEYDVQTIDYDCLIPLMIAECQAACAALDPDNDYSTPILGQNPTVQEIEQALAIVKRAGEFMFSPVVVTVRDAAEGCPEGSELYIGSGGVDALTWAQVQAVKQPIIDQLNDAIESARQDIIAGLDLNTVYNDLRAALLPDLYSLFGELGCPAPWAYENADKYAYESIAEAIIDQLGYLQQMNWHSNHYLLLDTDGDGPDGPCELTLSTIYSLEGPCDPNAPDLEEEFPTHLDSEFDCLTDIDHPRVATVTLCGDLCRGVDANECHICVDFIDAEEWLDHDPEFDIATFEERKCSQKQLPKIRRAIFEQLADIIANRVGAFEGVYKTQCGVLENMDENFTVRFESRSYHWTLYYYNRAGQLIKTVPPKGVQYANDRVTQAPHTLHSDYAFNSAGELIAQSTPDGGRTEMYYDVTGRIKISQNAEQAIQIPPLFSYTKYDDLSRVVEVGEGNDFASAQATIQNNGSAFIVGFSTQRTQTFYTDYAVTLGIAPYTYLGDGLTAATYLRNRVALSRREVGSDIWVQTAYSYDPHGNVEWLVQHIPNAAPKYTHYSYDLISGNVLQVSYNAGFDDQFYHCYEFDADNRILRSASSNDAVYWDFDAEYGYYKHGASKRTQIGEDGVQGLDYVYTLHGLVKGINHPGMSAAEDPGLDGVGPNLMIAEDAFGMILGYYRGDYVRSGSAFNSIDPSHYFPRTSGGSEVGLFNGNITSWQVGHQQDAANSILYGNDQTAYAFRYDQLNRLLSADFRIMQSNAWPADQSPPVDQDLHYNTRYRYDANGNVVELDRYGNNTGISRIMDNLYYNYDPNNNRLTNVDDNIFYNNNYTVDIDDQMPGNYTYDEIGNLTGDAIEQLTISWDMYGKISSITDASGPDMEFLYDGAGNRVLKRATDGLDITNTYYIRDLSGILLATYVFRENGPSPLDINVEYPLYGSKRLGLYRTDEFQIGIDNVVEDNIPVNNLEQVFAREVGRKQYELNDHLGNVRVVISDYKEQASTSPGWGLPPFSADLLAINNYYPFGMMQPERNWQSGDYRFGFNGKEKDDEIKGTGNHYDYGMRMYDSRIAKFLSVDPLAGEYPWYTPYQFAGNKPIANIDRDGLEEWYYADGTMAEETGPFSEEYRAEHGLLSKQELEGMRSRLEQLYNSPGELSNLIVLGSVADIGAVPEALKKEVVTDENGNWAIHLYGAIGEIYSIGGTIYLQVIDAKLLKEAMKNNQFVLYRSSGITSVHDWSVRRAGGTGKKFTAASKAQTTKNISRMKWVKGIGHALTIGSVAFSGVQWAQGKISDEKLALDLIVAAIATWGGPVGAGIGTVYFLVNYAYDEGYLDWLTEGKYADPETVRLHNSRVMPYTFSPIDAIQPQINDGN